MMQARWGTHGDHEILAMAPSTVQECLEFTVDLFNLAERYRNPAILLMDGQIGHLRERIDMPFAKDLEVVERRLGEPGDLVFGGETIPPMIQFGSDQFIHVTGSTHKENGMRDVSAQDVHDRLVRRLVDKIESDRDKLIRYHAALLVERRGLSADDARAQAEQDMNRHDAEMKKAKKSARKGQYAPKSKKPPKKSPKFLYGLHGPPMQGGAPGLGRKR